MFTGIVEEVGKVVKIEQRGENRRITVEAANAPKELGTGHSIAVSGVCLTALDIRTKIILRRPGAGNMGANFLLTGKRAQSPRKSERMVRTT